MSFLELATRRYSVRKFRDEALPRSALDKCFEAARLAPSACNSQPWQFYAADTPAVRDKVGDAAFSGIYSMNAFARRAPVLIAVVTGKAKYAARLGGSFRGVQFSLMDIGIACEHLVLCAAELGIGSCWLGWFNARAVAKALELPRGSQIDVMLALGYAAGDAPANKARRDLDDIRGYVI